MNYGFDQKNNLFCNYFYALIISLFEWIRLNNIIIIYLVKDIEKIFLSFFNKLAIFYKIQNKINFNFILLIYFLLKGCLFFLFFVESNLLSTFRLFVFLLFHNLL